ncbi:hypothetical protein [uncultured Nostoc sp.]|uniref:hypothetical protein n=1 Tax=uncultured Nostoc sp. TaxID=340711 RepID=UPI0035C9E104
MNRKRNSSFIQKVKQKLVSPIAWLALVAFSILLVISTTIASSFAQNPAQEAGDASTQAYAGFKGKIGRTLAESTPWWTPQPSAKTSLASSPTTAPPKEAPNKVGFNTVRLRFFDENYRSQRCDKSSSRRKTDYCKDGDSSRLLS